MAWTQERIEKLKALWEEGLTASRIAAELGEVTRNAVIGKAHRLGLSGRMTSKKQGSGVSIIRKKKISSSYNQKIIELMKLIFQGKEEQALLKFRGISDLGIDPKIFLNDFLEILYFMKNIKIFGNNNRSFGKIRGRRE